MRVEADLVDQLFNSNEKRLARTLLLLANFGQEGKFETIIAKISQETRAEMIGRQKPSRRLDQACLALGKSRQNFVTGYGDGGGELAICYSQRTHPDRYR